MNFKKIADTNFNLLPLFQEKLSIDYNFCILLGHYSGAIVFFQLQAKSPIKSTCGEISQGHFSNFHSFLSLLNETEWNVTSRGTVREYELLYYLITFVCMLLNMILHVNWFVRLLLYLFLRVVFRQNSIQFLTNHF